MPASSSVKAGLEAAGMACTRGTKPLFESVAFHVPRGRLGLLLGPNGSGKSTLLRALAGLHEPIAGKVRWDGDAGVLRSAGWRANVAYAGHKPAHKDDLSVAENLELACALEGAGTDEQSRREALEAVGLWRRQALPVKRLSQGQRQRLTLARLRLSQRPLWLLDEPTAALDADARVLLLGILGAHLEGGGTAVVATHDPIDLAGRDPVEVRLG